MCGSMGGMRTGEMSIGLEPVMRSAGVSMQHLRTLTAQRLCCCSSCHWQALRQLAQLRPRSCAAATPLQGRRRIA